MEYVIRSIEDEIDGPENDIKAKTTAYIRKGYDMDKE